MRKRSEARTKLTIVPKPRDIEAARYAWRERYAIALEGGASFKAARRVAREEVPDFDEQARAGEFDFEALS